MYSMFFDCEALTSLDLRSFNTSNVTDMYGMFGYCEALKTINLYSFDVAPATDITGMFYYCEELTTIYCTKDWSNNTSSAFMFDGCTKLVGENGTEYNDANITAAYACLDGLNGKNGYFSTKYNKVTVVAEHGTVKVNEAVDLDKVPEGTVLTFTATPESDYIFSAWENYNEATGLTVTSDTTVIARFERNVFVVRFLDWDDAVLKTQKVEKGMSAIAPEEPSRTGYDFTGWDKNFKNITSDLDVHATYTEKIYTVRFLNWNSEVLKTQKVKYGAAATAPEDPVREGYTFTGWDTEFDKVTRNLDIYATFKKNADEGIETVTGDNVQSTKILRNGQLFILRDGKTFNALGVEVK